MVEVFALLAAGCLLVVLSITLLVVAGMFRSVTRQLVQMNERLLVLVGVRENGEGAARALIASSREPNRGVPGIVDDTKRGGPGLRSGISGKQHTLKVGGE